MRIIQGQHQLFHKVAPEAVMMVIPRQQLLVCQKKMVILLLNLIFMFYVQIAEIFQYDCVKSLPAYGPICHTLKPSVFASGLDRPCLGPLGVTNWARGCGAEVCAWEAPAGASGAEFRGAGRFHHLTWREPRGQRPRACGPGPGGKPFDPICLWSSFT